MTDEQGLPIKIVAKVYPSSGYTLLSTENIPEVMSEPIYIRMIDPCVNSHMIMNNMIPTAPMFFVDLDPLDPEAEVSFDINQPVCTNSLQGINCGATYLELSIADDSPNNPEPFTNDRVDSLIHYRSESDYAIVNGASW